MAGISSLGIGSGVLTSDVIDQLKEADEAQLVKPIEDKISLNNQKQESFTLLSSLMNTLKGSASALSYDTIFDNKTVDVSGQAEIDIESGANVESFTLETVSLAKKDIVKFGALDSKEALVANGKGTLFVAGYEVEFDKQMTLSDLAQAITDESNGAVETSILQTGDGKYSLVVSSNETGSDQSLDILVEPKSNGVDKTGFVANMIEPYDATTNPYGYEQIQEASDSVFKYNGITTIRSTNEIDDLVLGLNISLKQEGDFSVVDINQDTEQLVGEMELFVESYNTLVQNLSDMTEYDEESGAKGVFNDESIVRNIRRELNNVITSMSNGQSLMQYGLDLDRSGKMSLNRSTFEEKISNDPDGVKEFFTGGTTQSGIETTGIFEIIDEKIKSYTGYGNMLSNFEVGLKSDASSLSDSYERAMESLTSRYEIMEKRFSAYDSMISQINAQFSSLQMMINAESNSN